LSLPMYPHLEDDQQASIVKKVIELMEGFTVSSRTADAPSGATFAHRVA
jgi:hypothetical protein